MKRRTLFRIRHSDAYLLFDVMLDFDCVHWEWEGERENEGEINIQRQAHLRSSVVSFVCSFGRSSYFARVRSSIRWCDVIQTRLDSQWSTSSSSSSSSFLFSRNDKLLVQQFDQSNFETTIESDQIDNAKRTLTIVVPQVRQKKSQINVNSHLTSIFDKNSFDWFSSTSMCEDSHWFLSFI